MPITSPSDLCWNVKFSSGQEWIESTVHAAIKRVWQRAQNTARSQFGDESLAVEMMEVAIEKLVRRLNEGSPADPAEGVIFCFTCMPRRSGAGGMRIANLSSSDRARSYPPLPSRIRSCILIPHSIWR